MASEEAINEAFAIFDRDGDGKISKGEVATAIRALGKTPSNESLTLLLESISGQVSLQQFKQLYAQAQPLAREQKKPMLDAFKALDTEKSGVIKVAQLRQILSTLGDVLSGEEIENLFKECGVSGDSVQYVDFVDKLVSAYAVEKRAPPE